MELINNGSLLVLLLLQELTLGLNKLFAKDVVHNARPVINMLITVCCVIKDTTIIKENVLKNVL
jgi:hypothetical protein